MFTQERKCVISHKCRGTRIARLFVPVWELALKLCQLAERPIQKKKKKFLCFHLQNKYPLYSTPRHTHTLQTWQLVKETRAGVCWRLYGSGRGYPLPRASCPPNSNASAVAGKPHRMAVNILYSKEKINTSSSEPGG